MEPTESYGPKEQWHFMHQDCLPQIEQLYADLLGIDTEKAESPAKIHFDLLNQKFYTAQVLSALDDSRRQKGPPKLANAERRKWAKDCYLIVHAVSHLQEVRQQAKELRNQLNEMMDSGHKDKDVLSQFADGEPGDRANARLSHILGTLDDGHEFSEIPWVRALAKEYEQSR